MGAFEFGTMFRAHASLLHMCFVIGGVTPSGRFENIKTIY